MNVRRVTGVGHLGSAARELALDQLSKRRGVGKLIE
jgi:hypothetical protein